MLASADNSLLQTQRARACGPAPPLPPDEPVADLT